MDRWEIDSINVIISAVGDGRFRSPKRKQNRETTESRRAGKVEDARGGHWNMQTLTAFIYFYCYCILGRRIGRGAGRGLDWAGGPGKRRENNRYPGQVGPRFLSRVRCQQLHFICSINLSPVDLSGQAIYSRTLTSIRIYTDAANEFMSCCWSPSSVEKCWKSIGKSLSFPLEAQQVNAWGSCILFEYLLNHFLHQ